MEILCIKVPKEYDRIETYRSSDRRYREFLDKNNLNNYYWHDVKEEIIYPEKKFSSKLNLYGVPEEVDDFEVFNTVKMMQNEQDGKVFKHPVTGKDFPINTPADMIGYWLISNDLQVGELITNTLKLAVLFKVRHEVLLNALEEIIFVEEVGGEYVECRWVNSFEKASSNYRRWRFYYVSQRLFIRLCGIFAKGKLKAVLFRELALVFERVNFKKEKQEVIKDNLYRAIKDYYERYEQETIKGVYEDIDGPEGHMEWMYEFGSELIRTYFYEVIGMPPEMTEVCHGIFIKGDSNVIGLLEEKLVEHIDGLTKKVEGGIESVDFVKRALEEELEIFRKPLNELIATNSSHIENLKRNMLLPSQIKGRM